MKGNIILIGGAPTTGKSTIAQLLSEHLKIPWISTDQIRELMQKTVKPDEHPFLFRNKNYSAEEFLNKYSAEEVVKREFEEGEATWVGVKAFINNAYPWKSFIVEGVAVLPHLVSRDFANDSRVKVAFLVDENADRIRDVVFTRGLWDDAHTYSDDVKEKEVAWAVLFSHKLKAEAEQYKYPLVEVQKDTDDLQKVLKVLNL